MEAASQEAVMEAASGEAVIEAASPEAVAEEMEPKGSFEWFEEFDQAYSGTPPGPVLVPGGAMAAVPLSKGDQEDSSSDTPPRYAWKGRVQPLSLAASSAASSGENPFSIQGLPLNPKASPKASASTPEPVATVAIEESTMANRVQDLLFETQLQPPDRTWWIEREFWPTRPKWPD